VLWVLVLEKAYAALRAETKHPDQEEEIGKGAPLSTGMKAFTTAGTDVDQLWATTKKTTRRKLDAAFGRGQTAGARRRLVTAAISSDNPYGLPKHQAYSVIGWDDTDLVIRNPWGRISEPHEDGVPLLRGNGDKDPKYPYKTGEFVMSLDEFYEVFSEICYEEED